MTVTEAIQQAETLGLILTVRDGMINVNGQRTPAVMALLEQMRPLKPELVAHLTAALEFTLADVEVLPVEPVAPIRYHTPKPPLPAEKWITGATSTAAWAAFQQLKQTYFCAWGHDSTGYTVTCDAREFEVCR